MPSGDRSMAVVRQDILRDVQDIVRSEVRLAKTELREEVTKARSASVLVGIGVPDWAAALIVAAGVAIVSGVTLGTGLKQFKTVHAAPKTVASLKENVEWAKQQTK
jgi:hypothetical protein